ncbi:MAG: HNH endonuclease [Spirochaetia bacterium]|nr:HNH endonuclease [Spirochaetia bacterium]
MIETINAEISSQFHREAASSGFVPDRRVEVEPKEIRNREKNSLESDRVFDPDKRIEIKEKEITEQDIDNYVKDLKDKSEYPETISEKPFSPDELQKLSPEQNREMRQEYKANRSELIEQWENLNGKEWPCYKEDVYDINGNQIREKGQTYDAHHIKPLEMGGQNIAENITPLHATVHYDARGVHSAGSPFKIMEGKLRGV